MAAESTLYKFLILFPFLIILVSELPYLDNECENVPKWDLANSDLGIATPL